MKPQTTQNKSPLRLILIILLLVIILIYFFGGEEGLAYFLRYAVKGVFKSL